MVHEPRLAILAKWRAKENWVWPCDDRSSEIPTIRLHSPEAAGDERVLPVSLQNFWADRDDGEMRGLRGPGGWGEQTRSARTGDDVRQVGDRDVPEVASDSW